MQCTAGMFQREPVAFYLALDGAEQSLAQLAKATCEQHQAKLGVLCNQACMRTFQRVSLALRLLSLHAKQTSMQMDKSFAIARQACLRTLCLQAGEKVIHALDACLQPSLFQR